MELTLGAVLLLLLLLIAITATWWRYGVKWVPFTFGTGQTPGFTPTAGKPLSALRFRKCVFTVAGPGGENPRSWDVTGALSGMAASYRTKVGIAAPPGRLYLVGPLNPFSFQTAGFNDVKTVADPTAAPWPSSSATLTGFVATF